MKKAIHSSPPWDNSTPLMDIAPGLSLRVGGTVVKICDIDATDDGRKRVRLEHQHTGHKKWIYHDDLLGQIASQQVLYNRLTEENLEDAFAVLAKTDEERIIITQLPTGIYSQAARDVMLTKVRWVRALQARGFTSFGDLDAVEIAMREIHAKNKSLELYRPSTIRDAGRIIEKSRSGRAVLPRFHDRGGRGGRRTSTKVEEILQVHVDKVAHKDYKGAIIFSNIQEKVQAEYTKWERENPGTILRAPSVQTISRRVRERVDEYALCVHNTNQAHANRKYLETGAKVSVLDFEDEWQFDDTDSESFLIDPISNLPWGRAYITMGIDVGTLVIPGFELSEKSRCTWSAKSALVNAILPTDMTRPEFSTCSGTFIGCGIPSVSVFDNALYNHALEFEDSAETLGTIVGWSKPHTPTGKSQIENANGTVKREFSPHLPGYRGPKRERDGLEEGPGTAVLTLPEFRQRFAKWVCDEYSNKPRLEGMTPRQMFEKWSQRHNTVLPNNMAATRVQFATAKAEYTFRDSGGILRMKLRYQNAALANLRKNLGSKAKVEIRFDPQDMSRIWVRVPGLTNKFAYPRGVLIEVPCIEPHGYANGLTLKQQQLILKKCYDNRLKNPSIEQMVSAREEVRHIVDQLRGSKKFVERRAAMRHGTMPEGTKAPRATENVVLKSELEDVIDQLDAIEIDEEEFA
jgi:putative transposase